MINDDRDLWPDKFEPAAITSPTQIMAEQAKRLDTKTDGLVYATIEDSTEYRGGFRKKFVLVAPKLSGYTYVLFHVSYPVKLYPALIEGGPLPSVSGKPAKTEEDFREQLHQILTCEETERIIRSLMRESGAKASA